MYESTLLKDKVIVVTGGGTGLGRSMAPAADADKFIEFPFMNWGEDKPWADAAIARVKAERQLVKCLYYYGLRGLPHGKAIRSDP